MKPAESAAAPPRRRRFGWRRASAVLVALSLLSVAPAFTSDSVLSTADILASRDPVFAGSLSATPGNPLRFDSSYVFEPDLGAAKEQLLDGNIPSWTTRIGAGRPLLASQQIGLFYPLTVFSIVLPQEEAAAVVVMLKILLAGMGMLLLARSLGLRPVAGLAGAIAFCWSPYLTSWLLHPHSSAYLLLPWLILAAQRLPDRELGRGPVIGFGVLGGFALLAGHPQSAVLVLSMSAVVLVARWWWLDEHAPAAVLAARVGVAALIAAGLGAAAILPLIQLSAEATGLERGSLGSPPSQLVTLVAPDLWGLPSVDINDLGPVNFAERTMAVGIAALVLALAAAFIPRRRGERLLAVGVVVGLALSTKVPGVSALIDVLALDVYFNLQRAVIIVVFCLSLLAAFGLERVLGGDPAAQRAAAIVAGLIVTGTGIGAVATTSALGDDLLGGLRAAFASPAIAMDSLASTALWRAAVQTALVLALLVAITKGLPRFRAVAIAGLLIALVGDLYATNHHLYRFLPPASQRGAPPAVFALRADRSFDRFVGQGVLGPNLAMTYGLWDARAHDLPPLKRYAELWKTLDPDSSLTRTDLTAVTEQSRKLLDLFSVTRVLFGPDGARPAARTSRNAVRRGLVDPVLVAGSDVVLMSNPTARPRAFFVSHWATRPGFDGALAYVRDESAARLRATPVIEGARASLGSAAKRPIAQRIVAYDESSATVEVVAPQRGYLVLTDTYANGWKATVNGRPATIRPADVAFRAVGVEPGRHTVSFRYAPGGVAWGLRIWALTWLIVLVALIGPVLWRRARLGGIRVGASRDATPLSAAQTSSHSTDPVAKVRQ